LISIRWAGGISSRIFGMGLRGPIDDTGTIDGGIDAFIETSEDDKDTTDNKVRSLQADLRKTFSPKVSGRLAFSHRLTDDRNNDASDQRISQLTVGVDRVSKIFDWDGRVGLDLENRIIDAGGTKSREFTPAINVAIARNEHSLSFNYRFQRQDKIDPILLDIDTAQAGLRYQLCRANNTFGLEYLINRREDTNGIWTRATQITAFWEHTFDEYYNARSSRKALAIDEKSMVAAAGISGDALTSFALGQSFDAAVASVTALTGAEARTWGNLAMADLKLFNDIPQRQRIVLENSENKLKQAVLVIDVDGSVPGQVGDVLERTRRTLIERYGTPSEVDERGTLGPRLAERHRAGLFARTAQWEIPGGVVRLGLPRRLDGRLKVEVHWAEDLGRVRDPMWGLEIME